MIAQTTLAHFLLDQNEYNIFIKHRNIALDETK